MIRINRKVGSPAPDVLSIQGTYETEKLKREFDNGSIEFSFNSKIYAHKKIKTELIKLQHSKCCFCESEITSVSYGDVEHYRPKGGWIQDTERLNTPGYYWLAYDWDNLLLSCQICNQQYKQNYFPLANNSNRALNHTYTIANEDPLFIHPVHENPEDYIEFDRHEPKAINRNVRGIATIKKMGLDRDTLNEKRLKVFNSVKTIYNLAKGIPDTNEDLKREFKEYISTVQTDSGEYASMIRCFMRTNFVDF